MSTKDSKRQPGGFVMPEKFSFGIEERQEKEDEDQPQFWSEPVGPAKCEHNWVQLPEEQQTLADEHKVIWVCNQCGKLTNTYAWKTP